MLYLICNKCNIYYEIENENEIADFNTCKCGNKLGIYNQIEDYINERLCPPISDEEESKGIFYSVDKKKLVYLQMDMLKQQKNRDERARSLRNRKYRVRHSKLNSSDFNSDKSENKDLKEKKEKLLKIMELLKRSD